MAAEALSKPRLFTIWKQLTNKPFPKVKAFQLEDADFNRVLRLLRCHEDELREVEEWNTVLSIEGTDACVFNADKISGLEYMILIRKHPYHSLGKILRHELSHIAKDDL